VEHAGDGRVILVVLARMSAESGSAAVLMLGRELATRRRSI
jgi:hypothetical protein